MFGVVFLFKSKTNITYHPRLYLYLLHFLPFPSLPTNPCPFTQSFPHLPLPLYSLPLLHSQSRSLLKPIPFLFLPPGILIPSHDSLSSLIQPFFPYRQFILPFCITSPSLTKFLFVLFFLFFQLFLLVPPLDWFVSDYPEDRPGLDVFTRW